MPFDAGRSRASRQRLEVELPLDAAQCSKLCVDTGASTLSLLHAVWAVILSRLSGDAEVSFGVNQGGRVHPVAYQLEPAQPLASVAREAAQRLEALRGADNPLAQMPQESVFGSEQGELAAVAPLTLALVHDRLRLSADAGRFDRDALQCLALRLRTGLEELANDPELPLSELSLLSSTERELVTRGWNARADEPERAASSVQALVARWARATPSALAVRCEQESLTYAALDARSSSLACALRDEGVQTGDTVALCLPRSADLIVGLLAILKAGAAYMPVEPGYPATRIAFMLSDAAPRLVLTCAAHGPLFAGARLLLVESTRALPARDAPELALTIEHPAYVLYTSGSTGKPKGVRVPHRAIDRLVIDAPFARLDASTVTLQAAPVAFDASTLEIWGPLANGGSVALHHEPVPSAGGLEQAIQRHGVTTLWLTAALFNAIIDERPSALRGVRQLLTGGEALSVSHVRRAQQALPELELINGYGPTETTTFATCFAIPRPLPTDWTAIPIGSAIRQTRLYVFDEQRRPVPTGAIGELYVGGQGVALGYLNRPELTLERFTADPFVPGQQLYRTGDVVRFRRDGVLEYVGRQDQQVKIRGFRIELGEVEAGLHALPGVQSAVVVKRTTTSGEAQLVAYCVPHAGLAPRPIGELRRELAAALPEYMVPALFCWLPAIPRTDNGKVDYRALPAPSSERPELTVDYVAPRTELERTLAEVWAGALGLRNVGVLDNIFELGASSLMVVRTLPQLEREHGLALSAVSVFAAPTVAGMAAALAPVKRSASRPRPSAKLSGGVAIVGMAGRFPGAADVRALWRNLCDGVESITFFTPEQLDPSLPRELVSSSHYVPARGVIDGVDGFDAAFFGITPKEATLMDPQQRVLLEVAWETLESAGWVPEHFRGTIGVFAGKYNNSYYAENVLTHPELIEELGSFQTMVANEKDYIATRIAHRLGLRGPAISVHTACSTSLVAVVQAYQNLLLGQCDMALAGGVSITVPVNSGHSYQEGAMLSADGHTRSFDAEARGTVFSDGAAMVLLKRLEDALADGDTIYGVIRGGATNNDGADKASFTAPSVSGQASVIALAQAQAGVGPREIGYVEAHGTATPLGDPIEVAALTEAFQQGTSDTQFCALGSVKSNLGHLVIAAGATGLIKTALCLSERKLVPSLGFTRENPKIGFARTPFFVNTALRDWESRGRRLAGVSSFGVGGTNAHVVVEEPPPYAPVERERTVELLVLSARSEQALARASEQLAAHLEQHPVRLADVALTLLGGRKEFAHRRVVSAGSPAEACETLRGKAPRRSASRRLGASPKSVAFMFPGQGAQYPGMAATLYREHALFRAHVDASSALLQEQLGVDLRALFMPGEDQREAAARQLAQTSITQPALFVIEHALAQLWLSFGVEPEGMIGHSVGEFVCAALAGVMRYDDALRLVAARGRLMQEMPPGAMLSVRKPAKLVAESLPDELSIAADNGPSLCVVAGPREDVERYRLRLEGEGVPCRALQTSHAFHSAMMDPVVERFGALVREVPLAAPQRRFVSTATGGWITDAQACDPDYWARHVRLPVAFSEGIKTLLAQPDLILLEVGPRTTLATLARQQIQDRDRQPCFSSLGDSEQDAWHVLWSAAGGLWLHGVALDPAGVVGAARRVPLPSYPFERKRFWVDPKRAAAAPLPARAEPVVPLTAPVSAASAATMVNSEVRRMSSRQEQVLSSLFELLEQASGLEFGPAEAETTFVELGIDSLLLTQFALAIGKKFATKISFRQLVEEFPTMSALAATLAPATPQDAMAASPVNTNAMAPSPTAAPALVAPAQVAQPLGLPLAMAVAPGAAPAEGMQQLVAQQLLLMSQQLQLLGLGGAAPALPAAVQAQPATQAATSAPQATSSAPAAPAPVASPVGASADDEPSGRMMTYDVKKAFGAIARITTAKHGEELNARQRAKLDTFIRRYNDKTKGSKRFTQESRQVMADPRAVTGFRPAIKELVYPIVVERSAGSRLWDVDGNEYVDALNGFGLNLFGWQPSFVTEAIKRQLDLGHEIGPQHPLQAEVARLLCELTGAERAGFCNTGSEAVMGCARIARTVTGRDKIAIFTGGYHGIFDEVVVRGTKKLRSIPAAPGIMPNTAENVLVLDYGTPESLEILKAHAHELAAIIVEPVQSRRPDFQPREFIHQLRELCTKAGIVYVFDEVVTGFRTGPGGAQAFYGVQADLASYGKVVGGGLPIGVIAGKREFVDALDGGFWQFGDESVPPVGVTYFAGTFVRHPLALASAKAVLDHLKAQGPALQQTLNARTSAFADDLNAFHGEVGAPLQVKHFASLWRSTYSSDVAFGDLLFYMMRDRGVHIYDGFPCFFTTAHSDADFAKIATAYKESVLELQDAGFLPAKSAPAREPVLDPNAPPVAGARLGRDPSGKPTWYVPSAADPSKYVKLEVA